MNPRITTTPPPFSKEISLPVELFASPAQSTVGGIFNRQHFDGGKLMKRSLILVGLCTAASLFAQGPPPGRGGRMGFGGPGGPGAGMMPGMGRTITGAPYSAVEVRESQQVLPNGNVITNRVQSNVARDSSGRMRTETTLPARGQIGLASTSTTIVNI